MMRDGSSGRCKKVNCCDIEWDVDYGEGKIKDD